MELIIYKPTEDGFLKSIEFNADEIKQELATQLEKYNGLVYSDDSIKDAKTDRATLNKFKDAIEARRKEIKKQCLKPYDDFEAKVKEIIAMIDKPILAIDTQVKNYEQNQKDEKLTKIKNMHSGAIGVFGDILPFDKVFNIKWLNATYKMGDIESEILDKFLKVETDLKAIEEFASEYEPQMRETYLKDYDLAAAIQEKKRLENQMAKLIELQKQQQEKAEQAAKLAEIETPPQPEPEPAIVQPEPPHPEPIKELPILACKLHICGTQAQLIELKRYMDGNGLKYKNLEG